MSDIRKLAHVEKILSLTPIEGADKIETALVLGWQCVVKKGEFRVGEMIVYIELDSIVPEKPEYEFLRDRKFRVRTIKLRKQISQGLVLPLSVLPAERHMGRLKEGADVTELLGIIKYDPQAQKEAMETDPRLKNPFIKFMSRFKWFRRVFLQNRKGGFPTWIAKTDEERIQNMPRILVTEVGTLFEITEKLDGQSVTFFLKKNKQKLFGEQYEFGVCSRNNRLSKPDNSSWWTIAKELNIEKALRSLINDNDYIVLQGEILGTNIQGNKYKVRKFEFYAFNLIWPDLKASWHFMEYQLRPFNVKCVPFISSGFALPETMEGIVNLAGISRSELNRDTIREGIVVRNYEKNISFKVINPEFLLKNNE